MFEFASTLESRLSGDAGLYRLRSTEGTKKMTDEMTATLHGVNKHEITVDLPGGKSIHFETGKLAKQAHGSCIVRIGDNVVLATACANAEPREGIDFFPLTVDYREYTYAAGRIPGGFIKREGRPSEREILTSRQIDRPIRPLFPEGFRCETQVIAMVLSADTRTIPMSPASTARRSR